MKFKKIKSDLLFILEIKKFFLKSFFHSFELKLVQNNLCEIKKKSIILFCTLKDEAHRVDYFIDYYKKLGIDHFIFVDNGSSDGFQDLVRDKKFISVFYTEGSYKNSNFGMHWLNYLLFRYGSGHWCLTCDPDEFFVYAHSDSRNLKELTSFLDSSKQRSVFSLMIDMYGKGGILNNHLESGQNPLEICPYYDDTLLKVSTDSNYKNLYCQGGVRKRLYCKEDEFGPAINKLPLIKWKFYYAYVSSMHMAIPRWLNTTYQESHITGALLHFKFISNLKQKVDVELVDKQHFNNSAEYKKYNESIEGNKDFFNPDISKKYVDWLSLEESHMLNRGGWK